MDKRWWEKLLRLLSKVTYMRKWKKAIAVGAACVVFMTTYMLVLPAITVSTTGGETSASSVSGTAAEPGMEGVEAAPAMMTASDGSEEESETVSAPGRDDMLYGAVVNTVTITDTITATVREADGVYTLIFEGSGEIPANVKNFDQMRPFFRDSNTPRTLQTLIIREGITSIGKEVVNPYYGNRYIESYTFEGITAKHIVLPSTLKVIGGSSFASATKLEEVVLPENLERLESGAFSYCTKLKSVQMNDSLKEIGANAFKDTAIQSIHIPRGFAPKTSFDTTPENTYRSSDFPSSPFLGIENLQTISVDENNEMLKAEDNVLYSKDGSVLYFVLPKKSDFTIPEHVTKIDGCAFSGHPMEELVIPEQITALGYSVLNGSNIKKLTVPNTVKLAFYDTFKSDKLEELTLPTLYRGYGYFRNDSYKSNWVMEIPYGHLTRLTFTELDDIPSQFYNAASNSSRATLRTVEITQNAARPIKYVGRDAFKALSNLTSDVLAQLPDVETIYPEAFLNNRSVQTLTLPSKLHAIWDNAFGGMSGLKEIIVNAENLTEVKDNIFSNASTEATVKIQDTVESLPKSFMQALSNAGIQSVLFAPNSKTILPETTDLKDFSLQLRAGEYYADEHGALYLLEGSSAKLAYIPSTVTSYLIPESVDGKSVTGVLENALQRAEQLTALSFETPENITAIERFAFANCPTLLQINDKTSVQDVKMLFPQIANWSENVFYRTGLTGIEATGTAQTVNDNGADIAGNVTIDGHSYEYTVKVAPSAKHQPVTQDGRLMYYTGEAPKVSVTFSGNQTSSDATVSPKLRVYFQPSAPGLSFERSIGSSFQIANWPSVIYLKKVSGSNLFYYETEFHTGQALDFSMQPSFANRVTKGGDLNVWAEIVPGDQEAVQSAPKSDTKYVPMSFETKKQTYHINKEEKTIYETEYTRSPYGVALQFGRSGESDVFGITFQTKDERGVTGNYGEDPVNNVSLTDRMTLPEGFIWNPKMSREINEGRAEFETTGNKINVYVRIDGERLRVLRLTMSTPVGSGFLFPDLGMNIEGKTFQFSWDLNQLQTDEASSQDLINQLINCSFAINFATGAILTDTNTLGKSLPADGAFQFHNEINADYYYFYSEPVYADNDDADYTASLSNPGPRIAKWSEDTLTYWGEDHTYSLAIYNGSFTTPVTLSKIDDTLNSFLYMKAENMEKMFQNPDIGNGLRIQLQHAALNTPILSREDVKDTAGEEIVTGIYSENTGSGSIPYNGIETEDQGQIASDYTITISKEADQYTLTYQRESETAVVTKRGTSVASLLREINYVSRPETVTSIHVDLSSPIQVAPGELKEVKLPVTFKDTFMLLGRDMPSRHNSDYLTLDPNRATVVWNNGGGDQTRQVEEVRTDTDNILRSFDLGNMYPVQVYREYYFGKSAYVNGTYQSDPKKIAAKSGDLVTYALYFRYYGSGERDLLPVTDKMQGTQLLLAEQSENPSLASEGVAPWKNNGVDYYVLNKPGTYRNIRLGSRVADYIEVKKMQDGSLETYIKWYLQDVQGDAYKIIQYNAVVPTAEMLGNSTSAENQSPGIGIFNTAWLNDHQTHRLTAATSGTILEHHKKIVDQKGDTPDQDVLNPKDFSYIRDGSQVTYRLELRNTNDYPLRLNASEIYDMLPITGTESAAFSWEKNINISMEMEKSSENIEVNQFDSWEITSIRPSDQTSRTGQQYIRWNPDAADPFYIQYPAESTVWIYVTLKFPSRSVGGEAEKWDAYENMVALERLENTLYVYNTPESVYHNLSIPGKVFLQKGSVGTIYGGSPYASSAKSYINLYKNKWNTEGKKVFSLGRLANKFYVMLYNPGKTKLYLDDLQDVLPEGFRMQGLSYSNAFILTGGEELGDQDMSRRDWWYNASTDLTLTSLYVSAENAKANAELNADQPINWKSATVRYTTKIRSAEGEKAKATDVQQVTFRLSNEMGGDLAYDADQQRYYLNPGEAFAFTYRVVTPQYSNGPDTATNRIAMKYYDPAGMGVTLDENLRSVSCRYRYTYSPTSGSRGTKLADEAVPNEGGTEIISGTRARELTFTDEDENVNWIASDVSLQKGIIAPDIHKEVISEVREDGSSTPYQGFAGTKSTIGWKTTVYNNGTSEMRNYKISDTMNAPYEFFGKVHITIHKLDGSIIEEQLFDITDRTPDTLQATFYANESETIQMNAESATLLEWGRYIVNYATYQRDSNNTVRFMNDDAPNAVDKKETMELEFTEKNPASSEAAWLLPGEYMEVTYFTRPRAGITEKNYVYNNTSMVTPTSPTDYSTAKIVKGSNVTDASGNNLGVRSTDFVTTSIGYATQSNKYVSEAFTPSPNQTHAFAEKPYIEVKNQTVDYKLHVKMPESNNLQELVLIDNLPEVGDTYPMGEGESRDSQMRIELRGLESNNWGVDLIDTDGSTILKSLTKDIDYTLEFSEENHGFTEEDWKGSDTGKWMTQAQILQKYPNILPREAWKKQRSIRLVIREPNPAQPSSAIMPAGKIIQLKFRAYIYDPQTRPEHSELPVQDSKKAWNSFGYSFKIISSSEVPRLYAASPRVGVMMKREPHILKRYLSPYGNLETVYEKFEGEREVTFLIYEGDSIGNLHMLPGEEVVRRLTEAGRKYTVVNVPPNSVRPLPQYEGYFEAELDSFISYDAYSGTEHVWNWENGKHYTVFEQYPSGNMPSGYRPFRIFDNQNRDWASSFPKAGERYDLNYDLTFVYDGGNPIDLVADNISDFYDFRLVKQDAYKGTPVQNNRALFAIYEEVKETDNPESTYYINTHISKEEFMQYIAEYNQPKAWDQSARTVNGSAEEFDRIVEFTDANGTVWRLVDVLGSGQDGTVKSAEVSGEENHQRHHKTMMDASRRMFVRELDAPIGYVKMETDQEIIHPNEVVAPSEDGTIHYYDTVVANVPTVELPETGGSGRSPFVRLGLALLGLSALTMYLYRKKRRIKA